MVAMVSLPNSILPRMDPDHMQQVIVGVFRRHQFAPMDLDALIHFAMKSFEVTPLNYVAVYQALKSHIVLNFHTQNGSMCRVGDLVLRRSFVHYKGAKNSKHNLPRINTPETDPSESTGRYSKIDR